METSEARQWVGIDVSQAKLDVALRPTERYRQVANDESGWQSLLTDLQAITVALVVVESTGGMEGGWFRSCSAMRSRWQ